MRSHAERGNERRKGLTHGQYGPETAARRSPGAPGHGRRALAAAPRIFRRLGQDPERTETGEEPAAEPAKVAAKPSPANQAIGQGALLLSEGKLDEAIAAFSRAVQIDPKSSQAYNSRGLAKVMKGQIDEAMPDLDKAVALDPAVAKARFNRGFAYYRKGDLDKALADYSEAIRLDPKYADAYRDRGFVRTLKGEVREALADLTRGILLNPKDPAAYTSRGMTAFARLGRLGTGRQPTTRRRQARSQGRRGLGGPRLRPDHEERLSTAALADLDRAVGLRPTTGHATSAAASAISARATSTRPWPTTTRPLRLDPEVPRTCIASGVTSWA